LPPPDHSKPLPKATVPVHEKPAGGALATITVVEEDLRLRAYPVHGTPGMKVRDMYEQVRQQAGLKSIEDFVIFSGGKMLPIGEGDATLGDCGVTADSKVDLIYKH
jgi:hypothetical protein